MNRKKKNIALLLICAAAFLFGIKWNSTGTLENLKNSLRLTDAEAITSCEIVKKNDGTVLLRCASDEGLCKTTKWGYELSCSGTKVYPKKE